MEFKQLIFIGLIPPENTYIDGIKDESPVYLEFPDDGLDLFLNGTITELC